MLETARSHFQEDIQRARALQTHAGAMPTGVLSDDLLRSAWMMAVGACDAYYSDAYADLVSRALRAKELEPKIEIPDKLNNLKVPAIAVLRHASGGWRWRMAARELIEDENVLSLEKIRELFNQFLPNGKKLINQESIGDWITHRHAKSRLFGISGTCYRALRPQDRGKARKEALKQFKAHYKAIFQRRHDCIHNCDRPKIAPQKITSTEVDKRIQDIEFLVDRSHEALVAEFSGYLSRVGFSGATRGRVCT